MQTSYKFTITSGMPGFMPNYNAGAYCADTRAELVSILKSELEMLDYPANRLNDFNIKRMWRFIQHAQSGSSCHSSCDTHNGENMEIHGLTDDEFIELETCEG